MYMGQFIILFILFIIEFPLNIITDNVSTIKCYQCVRNNTDLCPEQALLPCPEIANSCIKEVSNDEQRGFIIKRECAVGPCSTILETSYNANECDPKKDKFYCISCCTGDACNYSLTIIPNYIINFGICFLIVLIYFSKI